MDNEDAVIILKAITDLTQKVESYHGDFREYRGKTDAELEAMKLADAATDKRADTDRMWLKINAICVVPAIGFLHQIAVHLGWIR